MTEHSLSNPDAAPYFEALAKGEVTLQRCPSCGSAQFPPRVHCTSCGGLDLSWEVIDGLGTIYAKTVNRRAPEKAFEALVPYAVALVDLDAGPRVLARATCPPDEVVTGTRVRVTADPAPVVLPGLVFTPAASAALGAQTSGGAG